MSYSKQTWDTNSYVNPTRMNHIEDGIRNDCVQKTGDTMSGSLTVDGGDGSGITIGGSYKGNVYVKGNNTNYQTRIYNNGSNELTANRNLYLPNKSGTLALVEDFTPVDITSDYSVSGIVRAFKIGKLVEVSIEKTPSAVSHGAEIISKLPKPFGSIKYLTVGMSNGETLPCIIDGVSGQNYAHLTVYYPTGSQTPARIDATITYFADI